ncbi:MAG: folate family ECF transporter S component [Spiroplasma sp.]
MVFLWLNISFGIVLAIVFSLIIICDRKNIKSEFQNIKLIVLAAFLVALAVCLNTIIKILLNTVISTKIFEAKIGNFALVLIGFFCGGGLGFLAGIAADFLGLIFFSSGPPVLFFTFASVLWCILPYYLVKLLNKCCYGNKWIIYFYLIVSYAFTLLLISGFTPIVLKYMYELPQGWWLLYLPRIIKYPLDVTVNGLLLVVSYRVLLKSTNLNDKLYHLKLKTKEDRELNSQLKTKEEKND